MRLMTLVATTVLTSLVFLGVASAEDFQGVRFMTAAAAGSSITDQPIPPATDAHSARSLRAAVAKTSSTKKTALKKAATKTKSLKSAAKHSEKRGLTAARKTTAKAASAKKTTTQKSKQKNNPT